MALATTDHDRTGPASEPHGGPPEQEAKVVVIGAGFAGLGVALRLKAAGIHDLVILERAESVGGTWRDNTYPGCACDIPSNLYSFSFAPNPDWSRAYSPQPEIRAYLERCAADGGLGPHLRFGRRVTEAAWDEGRRRWIVTTEAGERWVAQFLVGGMGPLSEPKRPEVPGMDDFEGTTFHSATWDHDHDLAGERVAVIGTGASSIQLVPAIQPEVARLDLYQRTPPWIVPRRDRAFSEAAKRWNRRVPLIQKARRAAIYWTNELTVPLLRGNRRLRRLVEGVAKAHLAKAVEDPALRKKLTPSYKIGCKRILKSDDYYPALAEPNVDVVVQGIDRVTPRGIVTTDGVEREVDTIIYSTGFHVTDIPAAHALRGVGGQTLWESWTGTGMQAYKGTTIHGFPNLFMLVGPNTGLGHNSIVFIIESQVDYVLDAIRTADRRGIEVLDVRPEVQATYNDGIQHDLQPTVWLQGGCASWYQDAEGRVTTLWPGFTWPFRRQLRRFDLDAYVATPRRSAPVRSAATPVD